MAKRKAMTSRRGKQPAANPFCEPCGHEHGPLYVCPHYSHERKAELEAQAERLRTNMCDPKWIQEHLDRGVPLDALRIMGAFMGLTYVTERHGEEP